MSYQSLTFIMFSALALLLYYVVGRKRQIWVLALANLTFYVLAGVQYLPFILVTMLATYFCARIIGSIYKKADQALAVCETPAEKKEVRIKSKKSAKKVLIFSLIISVGLLAVCKYTLFAIKNVNKILSLLDVSKIDTFDIILPLGISFYTFMAISYVLDVFWKRYEAEKSFLLYAVFLSYFPHVVQGPIDRFNEFKEQVNGGIKFSQKNLAFGAQLAIWGFFKKLVIADRLALFVNETFDNWENYDGIFLIMSIVVYSIQIYTDFSGCIDIVSGISEMFGIKLRKNFNHPYFSRTMGEFWRRWHISLQEWFKDYIYFPVSASAFTKNIKKYFKNKGFKRAEELFASCFPVLVVWMITGLWHGAAWKFVAWGIFHACLLIGSQVFDPLFKKLTSLFRINTDNFGWHFWQMTRTFILCCIGRIFFRAEGIGNAFDIINKIIYSTNYKLVFGFDYEVFGYVVNENILILVSLLVLLVVDMLQEKIQIRETLAKQNTLFRWIIILLGLFAVILFGIYGPGYEASSFIYEQF